MLPEREPRRKPRRLGLAIPFVLLLIVSGAWSAAWFWMRGETELRMDAAAAAVKRTGGELSWKTRTVTGFPFRLDVALTGARVADPSGWALEAPELSGEAFAYALDHWVIVAPKGVTFTRPPTAGVRDAANPNPVVRGGDVTVTGEALRASVVADLKGASFPRIQVEGSRLVFATPQGAGPLWMESVDHLAFKLAPGPDDQGALMLQLDGAKARLSGLIARIAQDRPVKLVWQSTFNKASALKGPDWPSALRNWSAAGGAVTIEPATQILAGEALLAVKTGALSVDPSGRVAGNLNVELRQAPRALAAMGASGTIAPEVATVAAVSAAAAQDQTQTMDAQIHFEDGVAKLGPLPLMEAPRVW